MAAGNWVPELVALAGGVNLFGAAGKHSPWMTWQQLVAADPDVIVVLPCGFDIERGTREMAALTARPDWASLRAVRDGRVFVRDGNQYFNRPGPAPRRVAGDPGRAAAPRVVPGPPRRNGLDSPAANG